MVIKQVSKWGKLEVFFVIKEVNFFFVGHANTGVFP